MSVRRGMSLAEVLVVAGLLAMLFGLILSALGPGFRAWVRGERKSDAQQNALIVLTRISQEFQNAHPLSLELTPATAFDPDGKEVHRDSVTFLSCTNEVGDVQLGAEGDPIWQRRVVFYHDGDTEQVRSISIPLVPPTAEPSPMVASDHTPSPRDRIVARHVRSLQFSYDVPPTLHISALSHVEACESLLESTVSPVLSTLALAAPSPSPSP